MTELTEDQKRNENIKLGANWLNNIATAIMTAGTIVPVGQYIFGFLPSGTNDVLVFGTGFVCVGVALLIHLGGQLVLRKLR